MSTPATKGRNAPKKNVWITPQSVFHAMAYDLKLHHDPEVIACHALLCDGKFLSFVKKAEAMTSQMYTSTEEELFRKHQLAALFSKYPFLDSNLDREAVALEKFRKAEHHCKRMNQKFRARRSRVEPPHMQFMRNFILSVIGQEPNLAKIYEGCDFGPGSAVFVHGNDVSCLQKLDMLSCTPAALPVALAALRANHHYSAYLVPGDDERLDFIRFKNRVSGPPVQYNKIVCVPKNAKTDRTIAIEPTLNGFIQKGVDLYLRGRLSRIGVNLSSQSLNQALARLGSLGRGYATIDLSAASDSIAIELARELLPAPWFAFLNTIRSPSYLLPNGKVERYHKFCSMGNGFCFPLETLLFRAASEYAMSQTIIDVRKTCAVYGDDIIVPQECALLLLETLRDMGFSHNEDKTFIVGDFRESCGADYFNGENVRPVFIKKRLMANSQCFPLLNELARRKLNQTWQVVYDQLPGSQRYVRPYPRDDDSAINVTLDQFMASKHAKWNRGTQSWTWKRIVSRPLEGRKPHTAEEWAIGVFRGDLSSDAEAFSARFSERTRVQVGT